MLTDSVSGLLHQGLIDLDTVAQDGLRSRANAGAASFHRAATLERSLEQCQQQAEAYLAQLQVQEAAEPGQTSRRHQKAQERATRERQQRQQQQQALQEVAEVQQRRQESACKKALARSSTARRRALPAPTRRRG